MGTDVSVSRKLHHMHALPLILFCRGALCALSIPHLVVFCVNVGFSQDCDTDGVSLRQHWCVCNDGSVSGVRLDRLQIVPDGHFVPLSHVSDCTCVELFPCLTSAFSSFPREVGYISCAVARPTTISNHTLTALAAKRAGLLKHFAHPH